MHKVDERCDDANHGNKRHHEDVPYGRSTRTFMSPQPSHARDPCPQLSYSRSPRTPRQRNMQNDQSQEDTFVSPNACTKRELTSLCEVEDIVTGAVVRSTCIYIDKQDVAWFYQLPGIRKYNLAIVDLIQLLKWVPDENLYPLKSATTVVVSGGLNCCALTTKKK